jgi:hypothetical protein
MRAAAANAVVAAAMTVQSTELDILGVRKDAMDRKWCGVDNWCLFLFLLTLIDQTIKMWQNAAVA